GVATIDVKAGTKTPTDIAVGGAASAVAMTPNGKTVFATDNTAGEVSTIDVKTRKATPTGITVGPHSKGVAVTPDGKTAFVTNGNFDGRAQEIPGNTVSTIDVKTRQKNPTDITVGSDPFGVAITPDGKTAFVTNTYSGSVSTIDVKTGTKDPTDIPVGGAPLGVAFTPDGKTAFVGNFHDYVSTIDVKTRTKKPT